ncbi:hypothetical protein [Treponema parvum]|uniref:hypothetical protein n=1 Tax=Treponema parvum TaxID=138851 RepID=UPI00211DF704|nr:hypothetical protein [Treponema parvum]
MAKKNDTAFFENKLLDFVTSTDPMLEMLQWVMDKFMEIEVAHKPRLRRFQKGIHAQTARVTDAATESVDTRLEQFIFRFPVSRRYPCSCNGEETQRTGAHSGRA